MNRATPEKITLVAASKAFVSRSQTIAALRPTDLAIRDREFIALVGPSGCGKSTILNMIAGLFSPTSGQVLYDGARVEGLNRRVGYMTQKDTLLPWRTVAENIGISLELSCRDVKPRDRHDRVAEMVDLVGLTGFEGHYPAQLSGGMRKRAILARTLVYGPETLLMDEPFGALDAQLKLVMHAELLRLTTLRATTVVFVTHDLSEAIALADRVAIFSARPGRIKAVYDVGIAKPRDVTRVRFLKEFGILHEELWEQLKDEIAKGSAA